MDEKESKIQDVLGLKVYGEAAKILAQGGVDAAAAVLSRICNPVAEELGLLLRDKVSAWRPVSEWRFQNIIRQIDMTERMLRMASDYEEKKALPRLVRLTLEQGSWVDADEVREMWAGLLASSCTKDGKDESNLIFINILAQMTTSEAMMMSYGCEHAEKKLTESGAITVGMGAYVSVEQLKELTGVNDLLRLRRESDHMRSLGLIGTGVWEGEIEVEGKKLVADLRPTNLGLQMYLRCQGSLKSPVEYFGLMNADSSETPTAY
jgi:hypothetical protein